MLATGANPKPNFPIANSTWPSTGKGPQTITMNLDFTTGTVINGDLVEEQQAGMIGLIQGVYIDNRLNGQSITFSFSGTNQRITMGAGQEGILPVIAPGSLRFSVTTAGGIIVPVMFLDAPTPYYTSGLVQVEIAGGGGGALPVDAIQEVTLVSTALNLPDGADHQLIAANAARLELQIFCPTGNVDPVRIAFGGATVGVGSDWEITPGGFWQGTASTITRQAVHVAGTAGDNVIAYQG